MIPQTIPQIEGFTDPYFFFSNNADSEILYVSPSVETVLGYQPNQLIGRKYTEFLNQANPLNSSIDTCRQQRFEGGGNHSCLRVVRACDQSLKVLDIQTYGAKDDEGKVIANNGMARDVTGSYLTEQRVRQRLEELEPFEHELKPKERRVLDLVCQGIPNKVIASQLDMGLRTVEKTRADLCRKFTVKSIFEVVCLSAELKTLRAAREVMKGLGEKS